MPAPHAAHATETGAAFAAENRPAAHAVQLVAPKLGWNLPAAHLVQRTENAAPVAVPKAPAAQLAQYVAPAADW